MAKTNPPMTIAEICRKCAPIYFDGEFPRYGLMFCDQTDASLFAVVPPDRVSFHCPMCGSQHSVAEYFKQISIDDFIVALKHTNNQGREE